MYPMSNFRIFAFALPAPCSRARKVPQTPNIPIFQDWISKDIQSAPSGEGRMAAAARLSLAALGLRDVPEMHPAEEIVVDEQVDSQNDIWRQMAEHDRLLAA